MPKFIPDKPFKTYDEMMALLESRDVIFYKEDYDFVIHYLSIYPYYDLVNGNAEKLRLSNKRAIEHLFYFNKKRIYNSRNTQNYFL